MKWLRLLSLLFLSLNACDAPTGPTSPPSTVLLSGNLIEAEVGEWFNFEVVLGRGIDSLTATGPVEFSFPVNNVRCYEHGRASMKAWFEDGGSGTYDIRCIARITLAFGDELNVDQHFGKDVVWVTESNGLITQDKRNGDTFIKCVAAGNGTLWVAFTSPDTEYYKLSCKQHEQGGGS